MIEYLTYFGVGFLVLFTIGCLIKAFLNACQDLDVEDVIMLFVALVMGVIACIFIGWLALTMMGLSK